MLSEYICCTSGAYRDSPSIRASGGVDEGGPTALSHWRYAIMTLRLASCQFAARFVSNSIRPFGGIETCRSALSAQDG